MEEAQEHSQSPPPRTTVGSPGDLQQRMGKLAVDSPADSYSPGGSIFQSSMTNAEESAFRARVAQERKKRAKQRSAQQMTKVEQENRVSVYKGSDLSMLTALLQEREAIRREHAVAMESARKEEEQKRLAKQRELKEVGCVYVFWFVTIISANIHDAPEYTFAILRVGVFQRADSRRELRAIQQSQKHAELQKEQHEMRLRMEAARQREVSGSVANIMS